MGSSNDGSVVAPVVTADEGEEPPQRGFFGRILDAFSPPEQDTSEEAAVVGDTQPAPMTLPGIGNLRKLRVDDVAIPKAGIAAVPLDIGRDELVEMFRKHGFSRLPVYKGDMDHPQGLVLLKDLKS